MKNSSYSFLTLLVIGFVFVLLGLINIGIALFWDFSNLENMILGAVLLIIGGISLLVAYYWNKRRSR